MSAVQNAHQRPSEQPTEPPRAAPHQTGTVWPRNRIKPRTAKDFEELARTKLTMPVLSIGGEKANGTALAEQTKSVAVDVTTVVLEDTGHWVMEERPKETMDALMKFL